jgi:hypothetical protein
LFEDVGDSTEVTKEFADTWTDEFIKPILDSGESLSEGLTRLAQQYSVVKSYTELFGQSLGNTAQGILVATDNIVKAAGGLEQFNAAASSYYQNFYSEEERFEHFSENLTNVFKDLGLELPTTTQGFRDLVEGLDLTKEADQELYATLLALNPQVKQYIEGVKEFGEAVGIGLLGALRAEATNALDAVKAAVANQKALIQNRYDSERNRLEGLLETAQKKYEAELEMLRDQEEYIDNLSRSLDLLRRVYRDMTMDTFEANQMRRENAQALIQGAVASGIIPSYDTLDPALRELQKPSQQYFSTFEEYARDLYTTKNMIGALGDLTEETITIEEQLLKQAKDSAYADVQFYQAQLDKLDEWYRVQNEKLDMQLEQAINMYNVAMGIDTSLETGFNKVVEAVDKLKSVLADLSKEQAAVSAEVNTSGASGGGSTSSITDPIVAVYNKLFDRDPEPGGYMNWKTALDSGSVSLANLESEIRAGATGLDALKVKGFADGGIHTGGWRIVGEEGPELEYTPPSRIYSNSDSSDMFDMSELVAEVKQLREDMRSANYAIAKNTQKTAKTLEKFDYDGLPEQRVV